MKRRLRSMSMRGDSSGLEAGAGSKRRFTIPNSSRLVRDRSRYSDILREMGSESGQGHFAEAKRVYKEAQDWLTIQNRVGPTPVLRACSVATDSADFDPELAAELHRIEEDIFEIRAARKHDHPSRPVAGIPARDTQQVVDDDDIELHADSGGMERALMDELYARQLAVSHELEPATVWIRKWDWRRRCKSNACRPGNPFGCADINARMFRNRTAHILNAWLGAGHAIYLAAFAATGEDGASLNDVMSAVQKGVRAAVLDRGPELAHAGVVGRTFGRSVAYGPGKRWTVRRWVLLGMERHLDNRALNRLDNGIGRAWSRVTAENPLFSDARTFSVRSIAKFEVRGVTELIWGSPSSLIEDSEAAFTEGLRIEYEIADVRRSPADLCRAYFDAMRSNNRGRTKALNADGLAFAEFADSVSIKGTWTTYVSHARTESASEWNEAVATARKLRPSYLDVPVRSSRPKFEQLKPNSRPTKK